jgi:hypothetical protein
MPAKEKSPGPASTLANRAANASEERRVNPSRKRTDPLARRRSQERRSPPDRRLRCAIACSARARWRSKCWKTNPFDREGSLEEQRRVMAEHVNNARVGDLGSPAGQRPHQARVSLLGGGANLVVAWSKRPFSLVPVALSSLSDAPSRDSRICTCPACRQAHLAVPARHMSRKR